MKPRSRGSFGLVIFGAPCLAAAPVANTISVSEVEVSPSIVTALKLSFTPSLRSFCSTAAETGASVKTNDSMVAMSGAIIPAPLAMPLMVTAALPMLVLAVATFGNVSVVMIALAASCQNSSLPAATIPSITPSNAVALSGSPITPVEARKTSFGLQPIARAAISAVNLQACRPVLPVKALALPELTTSARGLPLLRLSRHHSTGADGHFDLVNTPAATVPGSSSSQQHVGAVGVFDSGGGGREPDAGDRRHVRDGRRGEGRDGDWRGHERLTR